MNITRGTCHEIYFVDEIFSGSCFPLFNSRRIRVTGKISSYNPITAIAEIADPERHIKETLSVNLKSVDNVPLVQGSMLQCFGELVEKDKNILLIATTARNVDGLDFQMYREAIRLRRNFLSASNF